MDESKTTEIEALVSLLGDEDPKIFGMVSEHLLELGAAAVPFLRGVSESPDPRLRLRSRHLLRQVVLDEVEAELEATAELSDDEFDLERASFALARIEYPDLDREEVSGPLDELAETIRPRLQGIAAPIDQLRIVNQVLFVESKFRGDSRNYYDADNVFLNRVLDRRMGVPISLASVYLLVAKRLELPAFGVGLPSNFLIRYGDSNTDLFIDPFLEGKLLSRRDCVQYLTSAGYYYKDAYISNSTARDMVLRTIRHLVVVYSRKQDKRLMSRLNRYTEFLHSRERTR